MGVRREPARHTYVGSRAEPDYTLPNAKRWAVRERKKGPAGSAKLAAEPTRRPCRPDGSRVSPRVPQLRARLDPLVVRPAVGLARADRQSNVPGRQSGLMLPEKPGVPSLARSARPGEI